MLTAISIAIALPLGVYALAVSAAELVAFAAKVLVCRREGNEINLEHWEHWEKYLETSQAESDSEIGALLRFVSTRATFNRR